MSAKRAARGAAQAATGPVPRPAPFADRHGASTLWALIGVYVAGLGGLCAIKYRYYLYKDFDLAIFTQATHQLLHGSLFNTIRGMNWLGDHSSLVMFLVAPLYAVFPSAATLLAIQTVALALGAVPVYALARRELGSEFAGVAFAFLYLAHPAVAYSNLYEFHPETLATGAILATIYFLRAERFGWAIGLAGMSLLAREDVGLMVLGLGVYAFALRRPGGARCGFVLMAMAAASLVLSFAILKPALNAGQAAYGEMYASWGGIGGLLTHPLRATAALVSTPGDPIDSHAKVIYFLQLLAPVLFLPLLSPALLLVAAPVLIEHLASSRAPQHSIQFQYTAEIIPFVLGSAILGMRTLVASGMRSGSARTMNATAPRSWAVPALAVMATLVAQAWYGPLGVSGSLRSRYPEPILPTSYERTLAPRRDLMLGRIGPGDRVIAGFEFLPRLANRPEVHSLHHLLRGRYTYSNRAYDVPAGLTAAIADFSDELLMPFENLSSGDRFVRLFGLNRLRPIEATGDLVLFHATLGEPVDLVAMGRFEPGGRPVAFDRTFAYLGCEPADALVPPGGVVAVPVVWQRLPADVRRTYQLELGLLDGDRAVYARLRPIGCGIFPVRNWPVDEQVRETCRLFVPAQVRDGDYALAFRVHWRGAGARSGRSESDDLDLERAGGWIPLGRVHVRRGATLDSPPRRP